MTTVARIVAFHSAKTKANMLCPQQNRVTVPRSDFVLVVCKKTLFFLLSVACGFLLLEQGVSLVFNLFSWLLTFLSEAISCSHLLVVCEETLFLPNLGSPRVLSV